MMMAGAAIGTASVMTGLYTSYHFNLPAAVMTLAASGMFALAVSFR